MAHMVDPVPSDRDRAAAAEAELARIHAALVQPTPAMIRAAWDTWHARHGGKLGPGPAFVEALRAGLAAAVHE